MLLWKIENYAKRFRKIRQDYIDELKYCDRTIKDLFNMGWNNNYIYLNGKVYELGYMTENDGIYSNFSLTKKQMNCLIKYKDYGKDMDDYSIVFVKLVNKEDIKYFEKDLEKIKKFQK